MTDSTLLMAVFGLVFILAACPSSKPSDNNDDAAGDGDPGPTTGKPDPGTPAAAGDGDGDPTTATCEPERKALADCEAPK